MSFHCHALFVWEEPSQLIELVQLISVKRVSATRLVENNIIVIWCSLLAFSKFENQFSMAYLS